MSQQQKIDKDAKWEDRIDDFLRAKGERVQTVAVRTLIPQPAGDSDNHQDDDINPKVVVEPTTCTRYNQQPVSTTVTIIEVDKDEVE